MINALAAILAAAMIKKGVRIENVLWKISMNIAMTARKTVTKDCFPKSNHIDSRCLLNDMEKKNL
jgi:hypothetical protein